MNYQDIANDVLNYAANKSEYTVQAYFNGPRVTISDSEEFTVFNYEQRGRRGNEKMKFEHNGKMFHYSRDAEGFDYWTKDMTNGQIDDSNEKEFNKNLHEFVDEIGGDIFWMA